MNENLENLRKQKKKLIAGIVDDIDCWKHNIVKRINDIPDIEFYNLTRFVTPKKACEIIGISMPTLNKFSEQGILKKYKLGHKIYFLIDDLIESIKV